MSFVSSLRERASDALDRAKEALESAKDHIKPDAEKTKPREMPEPSAAASAQGDAALADFVAHGAQAKVPAAAAPHGAAFIDIGFGGAIGLDSAATGGSIAAGGMISGDGTTQGFGTTGKVSGAVAATIGGGVEVGYVDDRDAFFGKGELLTGSIGPYSLSLGFGSDEKLHSVSVGVGKSAGVGVPFSLQHQYTNTEKTK